MASEPAGASAVPSPVIGTKISFLAHLSGGELAFDVASPALALWAAWWFVGLLRGWGHLLDDQHIGSTVGGTVFFTLVAIVAYVGIGDLRNDLRALVLESACPCCGVVARRDFGDPGAQGRASTACGVCAAYLRASGLEVSEERLDATGERGGPYWIAAKVFLPAATVVGDRISFAMPPGCAWCGSPETAETRKIAWGGAKHSVVVTGAVDLVAGRPYSPGANGPKISVGQAIDVQLCDLTVPVCARHTDKAAPDAIPLMSRDGDLRFGSYAYYKAFCALHRLGGRDGTTAPART